MAENGPPRQFERAILYGAFDILGVEVEHHDAVDGLDDGGVVLRLDSRMATIPASGGKFIPMEAVWQVVTYFGIEPLSLLQCYEIQRRQGTGDAPLT